MKNNIVWPAAIFVIFCSVAVFGQNVYQEEAKQHFDRGLAFMKMAKSPADYEAAIREFKQAAKLWDLPDIFFNLACAQEKTGEYAAAEENLDHYLLMVPDAGGTEKVKSLIDRLEKKYGHDDFTPLFDAAQGNQVEAAGRLIAQGADVNARGRWGRTPLDVAAMWGQKEVAELLIAQGADVNDRRGSGKTPLHYIFDWALSGRVDPKRLAEVIELLVDKGADINAKDEEGNTPLAEALINPEGDILMELVELLIAKGADIHARNRYGYTPLHMAAHQGHRDAVRLLIDKGADVNAKDEGGETPLHHAATAGQKDEVELLIAKGAKISVWNEYGKTPLQLAIAKNHREVADLLKERSGLLTRLEAFFGMDRSLIIILFVVNLALVLLALVNILRNGFKRCHKPVWILAVLLLPFLGSLGYWLIGRKQRIGGRRFEQPPAG